MSLKMTLLNSGSLNAYRTTIHERRSTPTLWVRWRSKEDGKAGDRHLGQTVLDGSGMLRRDRAGNLLCAVVARLRASGFEEEEIDLLVECLARRFVLRGVMAESVSARQLMAERADALRR